MTKKNNKGFSAVELMVALVIVGLVTALAIKFTSSASARAGFIDTLNQFVADYSYARQLASKTNRYVAIVFNATGEYYDIMTQKNTGNYEVFELHRRVTPKLGTQFYDKANMPSFTINAMGMVRDYPINSASSIQNFILEFFQTNTSGSLYLYKRKILIYGTGGIKVKPNTWDADGQIDY